MENERNCLYCGIDITEKRLDAIYCSKGHQQAAQAKRREQRNSIKRKELKIERAKIKEKFNKELRIEYPLLFGDNNEQDKSGQICHLFKRMGWTYNPKSGEIYSPSGKLITGKTAGYIMCGLKLHDKQITIQGHILAWYLSYNEVPNVIDHINRNKKDNRIENLRNGTQRENMFNTNAKGYYYQKASGKFQAKIKKSDRIIHLGTFETAEEAREAYLEAKKIYHVINK